MYNVLQTTVEKALKYSTPFGKIWMFMLFTFRAFIISVVGGSVYGDESGNFKCDTNQPGCQNVCFNRFSPISHMRFWAFHLLFVCVPSICFMTYAQFEVNKINHFKVETEKFDKEIKEKAEKDNGSIYVSNYYTSACSKMEKKKKRLGVNRMKLKNNYMAENETVIWTPKIRLIYILHLVFKLAFECLFLYLSYLLQSQQSKKTGLKAMWVPEKYECTHGNSQGNSACSQNPLIPCWVSRPWEKTIFMLYMTVITVISIILCLCEFVYVFTKSTQKGMMKKMTENQEKRDAKKALIEPMMHPAAMNGGSFASFAGNGRTCSDKKIYPDINATIPNGKQNGKIPNGKIPNGQMANGKVPNGKMANGVKPAEYVQADAPPYYHQEVNEEVVYPSTEPIESTSAEESPLLEHIQETKPTAPPASKE